MLFYLFCFVLRPSQQLRSCRFLVHITKLEQEVTSTSCTYFCLSLTATLNESTDWWKMTVEINLFHDQSSQKYGTGPGSNSLTP